MEQINSVELRGNVGAVRYQGTGNKRMAIFNMATSKAYNDKDGRPVIETTWHNIVAFESKEVRDLDKLAKGSKVYVRGRIRNQKFTGSDGQEHYSNDILASTLSVLTNDQSLAVEI